MAMLMMHPTLGVFSPPVVGMSSLIVVLRVVLFDWYVPVND